MNPYHSAPWCYILVLQATERKEGDHVNHDNHVLPWQPWWSHANHDHDRMLPTSIIGTTFSQPHSQSSFHSYYSLAVHTNIQFISTAGLSEGLKNKANSFCHVNVSQYCVDLHCIGVFISSGGGGGVLSTGIHQPRCKALRSVLQTHVPQGTHWAQGWCKTV